MSFKIHKYAKEVMKGFPKVKFRLKVDNYTIAYDGEYDGYRMMKHAYYMINGARYVSKKDAEKACEIINAKISEVKNGN